MMPAYAPPPTSTSLATPDVPTHTERIGDEIAELAAHIHAATYRLLELLVEFDRREGWGGGFRSCAHWLSWRTGIALGAAREKVRVARALPELPKISARMREGALSYSKVRALTRVATPDNEADLLEFARHGTTAWALASTETTRRAERYQVVVHTGPLGVLGGGPDDIHVSAETFRRLSCDGTVVEMRHDDAGAVLDVGRRARTVPPAMRRALEFRDGGCRFPACGVRHTDAHHVRHWADGGETSLENLALLCRRHHRAVHEGEMSIEAAENGVLEFRVPAYGGWKVLRSYPLAGSGGFPDRSRVAASGKPDFALRAGNRVRGVQPGPGTPTPCWSGEPLDLGFAIDVLRKPKAASDSVA